MYINLANFKHMFGHTQVPVCMQVVLNSSINMWTKDSKNSAATKKIHLRNGNKSAKQVTMRLKKKNSAFLLEIETLFKNVFLHIFVF